jgi:hypothetical protein
MHMINNSQRRAFIEVIQAASDMLEMMDSSLDGLWDEEWREAVRDSISQTNWLVNSHHIYISSKKED